MSVLEMAKRPMVEFNPANIEHRKIAVDFFKTGCWRDSPVRFAIPCESGDVLSHITNKLASYYLAKEFNVSDNSRK